MSHTHATTFHLHKLNTCTKCSLPSVRLQLTNLPKIDRPGRYLKKLLNDATHKNQSFEYFRAVFQKFEVSEKKCIYLPISDKTFPLLGQEIPLSRPREKSFPAS